MIATDSRSREIKGVELPIYWTVWLWGYRCGTSWEATSPWRWRNLTCSHKGVQIEKNKRINIHKGKIHQKGQRWGKAFCWRDHGGFCRMKWCHIDNPWAFACKESWAFANRCGRDDTCPSYSLKSYYGGYKTRGGLGNPHLSFFKKNKCIATVSGLIFNAKFWMYCSAVIWNIKKRTIVWRRIVA